MCTGQRWYADQCKTELKEVFMATFNSRKPATLIVAVAIAVLPVFAAVQAQAPAVDPAAVQVLQGMTDYLVGLKRFSVHTQNTYEDELTSGQRVDYDISANVLIERPNKLYSERSGDLLVQDFYYDGKSLALFNRTAGVYAMEPAPDTLEGLLDYSREKLGLYVPIADLVYSNVFPLLMESVYSAIVVGKTDINGVICQHLAFSRPDVDFQVWVEDGEQPLPCKYVVTDTTTPARYSVSTVMSDWNTAPAVLADSFSFVPSDGAQKIDFLSIESSSGQ
jgi:hypothetical protein